TQSLTCRSTTLSPSRSAGPTTSTTSKFCAARATRRRGFTLAKEYGQLRHDIWRDDDWLNLTVPAQHLYMVLLSDPTLNYCGISSWHVGRLSQRSAENSPRDTLLAALELAERHFIVVDEETEEVLIRSYLRHDPILKNPRLAVTMSKEYGVIGSRKLRAALVFELTRLKKAHPDWAAWEKPGV